MTEARFSTDFPFNQIVDNPCMSDTDVKALYEFLGPYPVKASATRAGFARFCKLLSAVEAPWKGALEAFVTNMKAGTYRREFRKMYNRRARISGGYECSQTSELFSLTSQALGYHLD